MSELLKAVAAFLETQPFDIIRISEIHNDGEIETMERQKVSFCS